MGEATAGRAEKDDCRIRLIEEELNGEVRIDLDSSVSNLYGNHIRRLAEESLEKLGLTNLRAEITDRGAMDWVLTARMETAARRLYPDLKTSLIPEAERTPEPSPRDRLRRSRLYLPGNNPTLMLNAGLFHADGIILDLEDSVHPSEKDTALILVRNALRTLDFGTSECMVRVNPLPGGLDEITTLVPHGVHVFLIPKAERAEDVGQAGQFLDALNPPHPVHIMPIIESALGLVHAYPIAASCPQVIALTFGAEDFTRDIGATKSREARETLFARSQVIVAARAADVQPIDTVFSDVEDEEGLKASVLEAKAMGFEGKGCIHPRQIEIIHDTFRPTDDEITGALKIRRAMEEAEARGSGVIALGSKMVDPPVVARALKVLELADLYGIILQSYEEGT